MAHPQLAIPESIESQQICFRCRYVGLSSVGSLGAKGARCPVCGFVLIVNSAPVALGRTEIDELFERPSLTPLQSPVASRLPGLSPTAPRPRARVALPGSPAVVEAKVIRLAPTVASASAEADAADDDGSMDVDLDLEAEPTLKKRGKGMRLFHEIAAGGLLVAGILAVLGVAGVL
ncbi:MAG: hypothetical protein IT370_10385 [Deltaproteobacteria bacterium]|nr:hypothetical protein [Deltaproteobacteria bacterium]